MRVAKVLLLAVLVLGVSCVASTEERKIRRVKVLRRVKNSVPIGRRMLDSAPSDDVASSEEEKDKSLPLRPRTSRKMMGVAGKLVPSQPEPPPSYLPYHYSQQKSKSRANPLFPALSRDLKFHSDQGAGTDPASQYSVDAQDLVALESQLPVSGSEDDLAYYFTRDPYEFNTLEPAAFDDGSVGSDYSAGYQQVPYNSGFDTNSYVPPGLQVRRITLIEFLTNRKLFPYYNFPQQS